MFQSTRPRGARPLARFSFASYSWVSIHAPTRGATPLNDIQSNTIKFQSTRPRGARQVSINNLTSIERFQSTRPRGARLEDELQNILSKTFQSTRPRGARRSLAAIFQLRLPVSIHAPTRGATSAWAPQIKILRVSIHAPTRGATVSCLYDDGPGPFQSTRPRGARRDGDDRGLLRTGFNPRAHAGRDLKSKFKCEL